MKTVRIGYVEIGEGRPTTIAPLTSSSIDGVMDTATSLADLPVDLAEWRIDMFADAVVETPEGFMPDLPYILQSLAGLRTVIPVALVATFRTEEEGGSCPISDEGYAQLVKALVDSRNVDIIDIEAFHKSGRSAELVAYAHSCHVPVVASWHDFGGTPEKGEIVRRLRVMQDELGADILKAAVMPQCRADVVTLLAATEEMTAKYADRPVVTVSMGELGAISRVSGQSFGSAATYVNVGRKSAPGQLSAENTAAVLDILEDAVRG